ncbi:transcriptional regulator [Klebsiella quasipneumoniae]|nr:transcriptional regulator [Klebsiella quasipneumoniae]
MRDLILQLSKSSIYSTKPRGVYAVSETGVVGRGLYLTFGLSRWLLAKRLAVVVLLRVGLLVVFI